MNVLCRVELYQLKAMIIVNLVRSEVTMKEFSILVIDDSLKTQKTLVHIFVDAGYQHREATNFDDGLDKTREIQPNLIIIETRIAGKSGFEFCKKLKNSSLTAHIPVIFLSQNDDPKLKVAGLDAGASDYIVKPFNAEELIARINLIFRNIEEKEALLQESQIDPETGLWNSMHFDVRLQEKMASYCRYARDFCVLFVKPDDLKHYQNTLQLSRVIHSIGRFIWQESRSCDIPCYYGEHVFSILLPETNLQKGHMAAYRYFDALQKYHLDPANPSLNITSSFVLVSSDLISGEVNGKMIQSFEEGAIKCLMYTQNTGGHRVFIPSTQEFEKISQEFDDNTQIVGQSMREDPTTNNVTDLMQNESIQGVLDSFMEHATDILSTHDGFLYIVDPCENNIVCVIAKGIFMPLLGIKMNNNNQLISSFQTTHIYNNQQIKGHWLPENLLNQLNALVIIPLKSKHNLLGIVGYAHTDLTKSFDHHQIKMLNRLAFFSSIAFENAQLFANVRQDIRDRISLEEELKHVKQLAEKSSRTRGRFLANMSHELRTPLNAIIGYSEFLAEAHEDFEPDEIHADLVKIKDAADILLTLINNVLDFSKLEAGKATIYLETFRLREMINVVVNTLNPILSKKSNCLSLDYQAEQSLEIYSDHTKVRQILLNLLSNAAKFTANGKIKLTIKALSEVDANHKTMEWIQITIQDDGIGMTAAQLRTIFHPFTQADTSTTRRFGGTGLGLTIARTFCEMLGGTIMVESQEKIGSTFTIKLPVRSQSKNVSLFTDDKKSISKRLCLLEVSPKVMDLTSVLDSIENRAYHIDSIYHLFEYVYLYKPDIILVDVEVDGGNDLEIYRRLKHEKEFCGIPVIIITQKPEQALYLLSQLDVSGLDCLTKPYTSDELRARIGVALRYKLDLEVLKERTQLDNLTGLWSENHFKLRFQQELASTKRYLRPFTLVHMSIHAWDDIINQSGLSISSDIIRMLGHIIAGTCRTSDIPCRFGKSEFLMILTETMMDNSALFVKRLYATIHARFEKKTQLPVLDFSFINLSHDVMESYTDNSVNQIIDYSCQTMLIQKQAGKNQALLISRDCQDNIIFLD